MSENGGGPAPRWLFIAGSSAVAAEEFARRRGFDDVTVIELDELLTARRSAPSVCRAYGAEGVAVHSVSWQSQRHARLLELALALTPARRRLLVDEETGTELELGRARAAARAARLPVEALAGLARATVAAARFALRRRSSPPAPIPFSVPADPAVLAVWLVEPGTEVGGAVSHAAGILGAFRRAGYRVGIVTAGTLPAQLAEVVDDVERVCPLSPGARLSTDLHALARDARVRRAARRLAARLEPSLVYQRHALYLRAGADIAKELGLPLVLEWNSSEAWARANWRRKLPLESRLAPLLAAMERDVVRRATVVAAVSHDAADMAGSAGARPERIAIAANAVELDEFDAALGARPDERPRAAPVLGWVGTYGPWHGAEVLVRALPLLPPETTLVLVGHGRHRRECEALAVELGVAERVRFVGSQGHDDTLRTLAGCDVLASPHVPIPGQPFFGSPTKLFEYMALGRPIVASRLGQLAEVLDDGRTAVLVEPGDPAALAAGIHRVLALPDRGESLGTAARAEAERCHTWDHRAATILDALGQVSPSSSPQEAAAASGAEPPSQGSRRRHRDRAHALLSSRAVRQAALFACSGAVVGLLATIARATLARTLSPTEFAGFAFAASALLLLAVVFEFGLLFPAGRAVARHARTDQRAIMGAAFLLYLPVGAVFCAAVFGLSYGVDAWFNVDAGAALRVTAPLAFVYPFQQLALWLAQGADRLHLYSLSAALGQLLFGASLVTLLAVEVGLSLELALAAQASAFLAGWIPLVLLLRPRLRAGAGRIRSLLVDTRSFGLDAYAGRLLSMGTYNMDVLLVAALADAPSVALYAIAVTVARAAGLATQGIGAALFPRLARHARIERRWLLAAWALGLTAAAALTLACEPLVRLVFSDRYAVGMALLGPLAFAEAIRGVTTLYNSALSAQGRGRELRNAGLALTGANLALNFTLIPAFGATGAAWASFAALAVNLLAQIAYYHRTLRPAAPLTPASTEAAA
jgi:glycosyltransferase involved in cell wall biosynthesis/O-antigen/teichoic acid export membrane protein